MKRLSVLLLGALALSFNACEKHPASQLPAEHATEFGAHTAGHGGHDSGHTMPAAEHAPAAPHAEPAKSVESTPVTPATPAPKFFPEKK